MTDEADSSVVLAELQVDLFTLQQESPIPGTTDLTEHQGKTIFQETDHCLYYHLK